MKRSMHNPLDFFAAPRNFVQPILPGWVFGRVTNITEQNSSAPDTEREIVAVQSYGHQLGRVMDAVAILVADLPKEMQDATAFEEFTKIHREINDIKAQTAARRRDRIRAKLCRREPEISNRWDRASLFRRASLFE
ncbi:hypothetical protein Q3C01_08575 [Bradyrhizobium sp. UFLA05-109]